LFDCLLESPPDTGVGADGVVLLNPAWVSFAAKFFAKSPVTFVIILSPIASTPGAMSEIHIERISNRDNSTDMVFIQNLQISINAPNEDKTCLFGG
jgi:hypothetical protein